MQNLILTVSQTNLRSCSTLKKGNSTRPPKRINSVQVLGLGNATQGALFSAIAHLPALLIDLQMLPSLTHMVKTTSR